jgi:hypothetical protein
VNLVNVALRLHSFGLRGDATLLRQRPWIVGFFESETAKGVQNYIGKTCHTRDVLWIDLDIDFYEYFYGLYSQEYTRKTCSARE